MEYSTGKYFKIKVELCDFHKEVNKDIEIYIEVKGKDISCFDILTLHELSKVCPYCPKGEI